MLDDFPQDEGLAFPMSPVNSVLDALACLHRPSPSPTPSKLEFTWSSGDIPLILYDNAYIDGRVSGLFIPGENGRESVVTLDSNANHCSSHHSQRFSTSSRTNLTDRHRESVIIGNSVSSDTIRSAATFGTRKPSAGKHTSQKSESTITEDCETRSLLEDTRIPQGRSLHSVSNHSDSLVTSRADDKQRLNIGEWYSVSSVERAGTPSGDSTYVEPPSSATLASTSLGSDVGFGDMKTSPSAQTWFSVSEWDYKDRIALDTTSGLFKRTSLVSNVTDSELMPRAPPASGSKSTLETMSQLQPSHIRESVQYHQEALSPFESPSDSDHHGFDTFLRATSVQFLIDQEGFRDAEPSFKFCGMLRVRSSGDDRTPDKIRAQFRPISRQQFHFHHAPFESPPILRRITVNNDDASDYVSRQAHLILKSNGVYVIHGHEVLSAEQASEQTKLYWQFEYLVDDRHLESSSGSRRHLEGEKTFTPLTFSCSPRLLLPSQAKRIGIMHVFRKSLAPKFVAEKLQVRLGTDRSSSASPEKTLLPKAPDYRISYSHDRRSRGAGDKPPSKRSVNAHVSLPGQNGYGPTDGGRRATAFGQESLSRFSTHIPSSSDAKRDDRNSSTNAIDASHLPAVDRHIVPPARLSELLTQDSSSNVGHGPGRVTPGYSSGRATLFDTSERDSTAFTALSPRPKRPASLILMT